jgi:hypothetical protein
MSDDTAPRGEFLARIEYLKPPDQENRFARLRPLYEIDANGWRSVTTPQSEFPNEGLVFSWNPQPSWTLVQGQLVVVRLESQPKYSGDSRHGDQYQVSHAFRTHQPHQALSLYGVGGRVAFRRAIASARLEVETPVLGRPLVRVAGGAEHWISLPEVFSVSSDSGRNVVTATGLNGLLPVFRIPSEAFQRISVDGRSHSLLLDPGVPTHYFHALSDTQLIEQLRKRISSVDRDAFEALNVTRNLVRQYVETIGSAGLGGEEAAKEDARREAATLLMDSIESDVEQIDAAVDMLLEHPRVRDDLERRIEAERRQRAEEWEQSLAQEHSDAVGRLAAIRNEIDSATSDLESLRSSISGAVDEIIEAPVDALVRHGLLDALRKALPLRTTQSATEVSGDCTEAESVEAISTVERLKEVGASWAAYAGIDAYLFQIALAAVLAHRVTVLSGSNAELLAETLANIVSGDRAVRVAVGTAVFGLSDLMDSPAVRVGAAPPDRISTLGDYLIRNAGRDPAVIILSGCNRAPPEIVLPEWLETGDGRPSVLAWSRDHGIVRSAAVGDRFRIIGTLHRGDATYRLPANLGPRLAVVPADHRELELLAISETSAPPKSRIDPEVWDGLERTVATVDLDACVRWLQVGGTGSPPRALRRALVVYVGLLGDSSVALAEALAALVLGRDGARRLEEPVSGLGDRIVKRLRELADTDAWRDSDDYFWRRRDG